MLSVGKKCNIGAIMNSSAPLSNLTSPRPPPPRHHVCCQDRQPVDLLLWESNVFTHVNTKLLFVCVSVSTMDSCYDIREIFRLCCRNNDLERAKILVDSFNVDVNAVSSDGTSSGLAEAARSNSVEVVEWLLSLENTNVNIRTIRIDCDPYHSEEWMELPWWTPLMHACEADHGDIVRMLTEHPKISMFYADKNKWTAAHVAARCNSHLALNVLTRNPKVNWNAQDWMGHTPLFLALENGSSCAVRILLSRQGRLPVQPQR